MILILLAILLVPCSRADFLSDLMFYNSSVFSSVKNKTEPEYYSAEDDGANHDHDNPEPEFYSWDSIYLCTYCYDTEVILDPYSDGKSKDYYYYDDDF
jgi:hypothetical protein